MFEPWLLPQWPAAARVGSAVSTRYGAGLSQPPYGQFNLGLNCGEYAENVLANRGLLQAQLALSARPCWLKQVHGTNVWSAGVEVGGELPQADAAITRAPGTALAILTADCLPVLFCATDGSVIGAAHAGWRGLAGGVLENTLAAMRAAEVMAWLGPCIGSASYEVGEEVRAAFVDKTSAAASAFSPTRPGHWLCDLEQLARQRLAAIGVQQVYGGGFDTRTDGRFYSYRGEGARSGRFASLIWLKQP